MASVANQPAKDNNLSENFTYRNTDFGGRWSGANGELFNKLKDKAKDLIQSEVEKLKGNSKDSTSGDKTPPPPPSGPTETKILGMHPMTLVLGTVGLLVAVGFGVYVFKKIKK